MPEAAGLGLSRELALRGMWLRPRAGGMAHAQLSRGCFRTIKTTPSGFTKACRLPGVSRLHFEKRITTWRINVKLIVVLVTFIWHPHTRWRNPLMKLKRCLNWISGHFSLNTLKWRRLERKGSYNAVSLQAQQNYSLPALGANGKLKKCGWKYYYAPQLN